MFEMLQLPGIHMFQVLVCIFILELLVFICSGSTILVSSINFPERVMIGWVVVVEKTMKRTWKGKDRGGRMVGCGGGSLDVKDRKKRVRWEGGFGVSKWGDGTQY